MLLVPRQLRRAGLTGDVPYYGGRFTPAQAYAVSHPSSPRPAAAPPSGSLGRTAVPVTAKPARSAEDTLRTLERLRDEGVITPEEYDDLRSRTAT
jgi:hypothetical protein